MVRLHPSPRTRVLRVLCLAVVAPLALAVETEQQHAARDLGLVALLTVVGAAWFVCGDDAHALAVSELGTQSTTRPSAQGGVPQRPRVVHLHADLNTEAKELRGGLMTLQVELTHTLLCVRAPLVHDHP